MENNKVLITGGLGFIGAHFVHHYRQVQPKAHIIVFDKNTYAANINRIDDLVNTARFTTLREIFLIKKPLTVFLKSTNPHMSFILLRNRM
jgi:dTDP-D-glucose 4,6-dehydratase